MEEELAAQTRMLAESDPDKLIHAFIETGSWGISRNFHSEPKFLEFYTRWRDLQYQRGSFKEKAGRFAAMPARSCHRVNVIRLFDRLHKWPDRGSLMDSVRLRGLAVTSFSA